MTAAMARRGGAGDLGPEQLDDEVDALGARIEASTSWSRTVLVLDSGSESLDRGLELLASVLFEPRFDEARLEQAKENLRVSLVAEADDPRAVLDREWQRLVHGPDSKRSRRLTEASVAAFERAVLARFHGRHWSPDGAVIAASGDVEPEALVARLDKLFGGWKASVPASVDEAVAVGKEEDQARGASPGGEQGEASSNVAAASPGWRTIDREGPQAAIAIGHRGAVFATWDDPDRWALMLLTEILDGPGAVSRLRSRLQLEEGLTYRVLTWFDLDVVPAASISARSKGGGEFRVFLETAPESAATASSVVVEELSRLRQEDVPGTEIATRQAVASRPPAAAVRSRRDHRRPLRGGRAARPSPRVLGDVPRAAPRGDRRRHPAGGAGASSTPRGRGGSRGGRRGRSSVDPGLRVERVPAEPERDVAGDPRQQVAAGGGRQSLLG